MSNSDHGRRNFIKLLGSAVAGASLASCGKKAETAAGGGGGARDHEMNILCWEGYNTESVLGPFRKKFPGISLKAESGTDDPSMINKLRAGEIKVWDLINLNQCWARDDMWKDKLIMPLNQERFMPYLEKMMHWFYDKEKGINAFAKSPDGKDLIGMMQRFGPFSFVVDTKKIAKATAEEQGWNLFLDPKMKGRYGLMAYDNWNVMHIAITAGLNPFKKLSPEEIEAYKKTADLIFAGAKLITADMVQMNQALVNGEIDAYYSGGTYTASTARFEGYSNVYAISPLKGPVDGKGAMQWFEVTSLVNNPAPSPRASDFLEFVQQPEICKATAFAEGTYNPVTQMAQPDVFGKFNKKELEALQWDALEEEMNRSVDYQVCPDNDLLTKIYTEAKRTKA